MIARIEPTDMTIKVELRLYSLDHIPGWLPCIPAEPKNLTQCRGSSVKTMFPLQEMCRVELSFLAAVSSEGFTATDAWFEANPEGKPEGFYAHFVFERTDEHRNYYTEEYERLIWQTLGDMLRMTYTVTLSRADNPDGNELLLQLSNMSPSNVAQFHLGAQEWA